MASKEEHFGLLDDENLPLPSQKRRPAWTKFSLAFFLCVSLILNIHMFVTRQSFVKPEPSPYTGIQKHVKVTHVWSTEYSSENDTEVQRKWEDMKWGRGIVALDKTEAAAKGLPTAHDFPWDSDKKSLYLINAHHGIHCIKDIFSSIKQYRENSPQTVPYRHLLHCMDNIRLNIMCTADDTLFYIPQNNVSARPGEGQERTCRDWSELDRWIDKHDPCYRDVPVPSGTNLEKMKFCPENSPYLPLIRQYFGYDENWVPPTI